MTEDELVLWAWDPGVDANGKITGSSSGIRSGVQDCGETMVCQRSGNPIEIK